jgi:hypothetical protein
MSEGAATAFAVALALSAVTSAMIARHSAAKFHIDFAAAVFAALALSVAAIPYAGARLADDVGWIAIAMTPAALAFACYGRLIRPPAAMTFIPALIVCAGCGALAIALHYAAPALLSFAAGTIALLVLAVLHLRGEARISALMLGACVALVAGVSAFLQAGASAFLLFAAAGLLGIALATASRPPVNLRGWSRRVLKVRGKS